MQLAGLPCSICSQNVTFERDATWCGACKTVFHHDCISQRNNNCPNCKRRYDPPESHFVFSEFCPGCLNRNDFPQLQCNLCHARTQWDTREDYEQFVTHMKGVAHIRLLRGIAELTGGALCLLAIISTFAFLRPGFIALCLFMLGFMTLTADGLVSILNSRKIRRFK
jgi:hypothetical protein